MGKLKNKIFYILPLTIFFSAVSCDTNEPPTNSNILLKLEDVSCTEAWIELTTTNLQLPATITIKQFNPTGDSLSQDFILNTQDSLLYIDSLLPSKGYQYQVLSNEHQVSSNELNVTTMDTTSHDFTFETFTFGEHGNSVLYDVAIVGDEIWAVGEIFMNDSLGQPDPQPYGIAIWDGQNWELKKIFHSTNIPVTSRGILVISSNEIYLAAGSIFRWDGISSTVVMVFSRFSLPDPNATIEKLWGSSSTSIFGVGNVGSIVYYNGTGWSRIESGTDVDLKDVWGSPDGSKWTCGYNSSYSLTVLIKINNSTVAKLYEGSPNNQNNNLYIGPLSGGWTNSKFFTYLLNWGALYRQDNKGELDLSSLSQPFFYDVAFDICANDKNDIVVSGESGMFGHYNGVRFYDLPDLRRSNIQFLGNDIKDNLFITVGWDYSSILTKAIVTMARR